MLLMRAAFMAAATLLLQPQPAPVSLSSSKLSVPQWLSMFNPDFDAAGQHSFANLGMSGQWFNSTKQGRWTPWERGNRLKLDDKDAFGSRRPADAPLTLTTGNGALSLRFDPAGAITGTRLGPPRPVRKLLMSAIWIYTQIKKFQKIALGYL